MLKSNTAFIGGKNPNECTFFVTIRRYFMTYGYIKLILKKKTSIKL